MRTEYLTAIVIAVLAFSTALAATALAANFVGSRPSENQFMPGAVQVADRLAASVDPFLRAGG
jgi:hypothetical protein